MAQTQSRSRWSEPKKTAKLPIKLAVILCSILVVTGVIGEFVARAYGYKRGVADWIDYNDSAGGWLVIGLIVFIAAGFLANKALAK